MTMEKFIDEETPESPEEIPKSPEEQKVAPKAPEGGGDGKAAPAPPAGAGGGGAPQKKKIVKKPREKNEKFKDVEQTGKWGEISQTETYAAIACFAVIVIGVIVAVVIVVTGREDPAPLVVEEERVTPSPSSSPTRYGPDQVLNIVLDDIRQSKFLSGILENMPSEASAYEGLRDDPNATPQQKAMSWLLIDDDDVDVSEQTPMRWALASIFYQMKGESWTRSENWLSQLSLCEWENVECDPISDHLRELDLQGNNLAGTIPSELVLLTSLQSLWLGENGLTGPIPGEMLGSMPKLTILYLDNNKLTGTVPASLLDNGGLNSLFVQFNNLGGDWPEKFCPATTGGDRVIDRVGLDCDKVKCDETFCCTEYDCYYAPPLIIPDIPIFP